MLAVSWDTVRLFLHVLAATIWVGGQLVLAALVPALRRFGAEVPRAAASRFNQVAWAAFAVLIRHRYLEYHRCPRRDQRRSRLPDHPHRQARGGRRLRSHRGAARAVPQHGRHGGLRRM
jgi:hypothetical protein